MSERTETRTARLEQFVVLVLATAAILLATNGTKAWLARAVPVDVDELHRRWYGDSLGYQ